MKVRVYPYKQGSKSAKALSEVIGGKVLKHVGSKFRPKVGDVVINWGASQLPDFGPARVFNVDAGKAGCKLASFRAFAEKGVSIPEFWTKKEDIPDEAFPVVCRTKLRGHSGDGIVMADGREGLVNAPIYTKYTKKKDEYRVHVAGDKSFFIQRKARRLDVEQPDWRVRNLQNGFVFVEVEERDVPKAVISAAVSAVLALNLDFGGVDVLWNDKEGKAYAIECNTACGLERRTAEKYSQAILATVQN